MVTAIRHESSYETGVLSDELQGVYVGWAARKGSFSERMPVRNETGEVTLVFAGEEYPPSDTIRRLKQTNHTFDDGPSYLVHLYEEDPGFPAGLNGRFHGLLTDRNRGTSTLFNDRYGLHRIYYHESKEAFYFATEAKAILALLPELRAVDPQGLGEFISCGCVLEDRTLFEGIRLLPPAAAWVFRAGAIESKNVYFQPREWENQDPLDPESYYQRLRETFSSNLPRYFTGDERIGMSLTGGLDTRMIMAWQKSSPGTLPCYSFGGMFRDCQDVLLARKVAQTCGQPHQVIPIAAEFLADFSHYAERTVYLTDGCAGVTRSSDLYANEIAAEIAPVRMTGNYGSEILRRIVAFKPGESATGPFCPEILPQVNTAKETYSKLRRRHALSFIAFCQTPWHHHSLRALEETKLSLRSPFLDNDLVQLAFRAPGAAAAKKDIFAPEEECVRLIEDGNPALRRLRTDRGLAGDSGSLSAAFSRSFLEFTFKAEYAYDYGMPQSLARIDHCFSKLHLERLFLGRHKFNHFRIWYRDALSQYIREMLLDQRTLSRPYLDGRAVEAMVQGHLKGNRNHTSEIHTVLTLELIHRLFVDGTGEHTSTVREAAVAHA